MVFEDKKKELVNKIDKTVKPRMKRLDRAFDGSTETRQEIINYGDLDQAQEWLDKMPQDDVRVWEKQGWVDELRGNYTKAEVDFQKVLDSGQMDSPSYRTAVHFLGRAKFGLDKIGEARRQFEQDLARTQKEGDINSQAYNLRWLAKCDLVERRVEEAKQKLQEIFAHMLNLEGMIKLEEQDVIGARADFVKARKIWQEDDPYVRGAADALIGQGVCDLLEEKETEAVAKANLAQKEYPWVWGNMV